MFYYLIGLSFQIGIVEKYESLRNIYIISKIDINIESWYQNFTKYTSNVAVTFTAHV